MGGTSKLAALAGPCHRVYQFGGGQIAFMVTSGRHERVLPAHLCRVVWQQAEVANSKLKVKIDELSLFYH
jgi:hypothetical protein